MTQQLVFSNVRMCVHSGSAEKNSTSLVLDKPGLGSAPSIPEASGSRMEGGGCGSHGVVSRLSLIPTVSF